MRTREIFRYLVAMIIALSTTVNAMAQQRALKIYFNENGDTATGPRILVKDDNGNYELPKGLKVTLGGAVWADKARFWEMFQQDVSDRVIAAYTASDKKESKLTLSFVDRNEKSTMPYEVNSIQWNVMNDLLSSSILDLLDNYRITTKCIPANGTGWSSTDEKWDMNFLVKTTKFTQKNVPWQENAVLNGLKSFEIGEQCWRKSPLGILINHQVELDDKCRTFIKAGWNGSNTNSNIDDSDDSNWAFKVTFTLPDIRMRCYSCRVANNVILGELDNNIIVGESGKHALRGYIAAHGGAVVPTHDPSDIDAFHYEYFADDNQIVITQNTGVISNAKVAGDIPVTVKLMRGTREVCSYTQTIHVMAPSEVLAKIAIGFENGNKGYDITVGDQNAQIKGVFTENANNIAPTEDPNGYHFEYTESSNGQIIAIDKYTGKITAKKEGDVDVSAVLKNGENIISNTYTYSLHVFAKHEGMDWKLEKTYTYTNSSNKNDWKISTNTTNSSSNEWESKDLLMVNTTINGSSDWKQIACFTTPASQNWRGICQTIQFDLRIPKYTKVTGTYPLAGNLNIGSSSKGSIKYGFECKDLGAVDAATADTRVKSITWKTQGYHNGTNASTNTYPTQIIADATSYNNGNIGNEKDYHRSLDNSTSEHVTRTRYLAIMAYLHRDNSYPGDASFGFKNIPTYEYYSTVTYYMNDGTENTCGTSDSYTSNSKTGTDKLYKNPNSDTKPKPTRVGYEFLGWSTNPEATVAEYEYQGQFCPYDDVNGGGKGPVSLHAVWRANTYTVELRRNSKDDSPVDAYVYATYDQKLPSVDIEGNPVMVPITKGYDFKGYYGEGLGGGNIYYNEDMSSNHIWDRTETDKNYVIARWYAHKSTVVFDPQGGNNYGATRVTATFSAAMPTEGVQAPQRQGYTFGGYYSEANGQGTQYYTANMTSATTWDIDERLLDPQVTEVTLYAKWISHTYTVTLDPQGGTGGSTSVTAAYGQPLPSGLTAPTKPGYEFKGYYSNQNQEYAESMGQDYGGTQYYDKDMVSVESWNSANSGTIYAHWAPATFIVTLDGTNGAIVPNQMRYYSQKPISDVIYNSDGVMKISFKYGGQCPSQITNGKFKKAGFKLLGFYDSNNVLVATVNVDHPEDRNIYFNESSGYWTRKNGNFVWNCTHDVNLTARYEPKYTVRDGDIIDFGTEYLEVGIDWENSMVHDLLGAAEAEKEAGRISSTNPVMVFDIRNARYLDNSSKKSDDLMVPLRDKDFISPNLLVYLGEGAYDVIENEIKTDGTCPGLVVTDRFPIKIPTAFTASKASYARDAQVNDAATEQASKSTWGTLCLPYPIKNNTNGVKFYWLESTANNYMEFKEFDDNAIIPANTPVLYSRTDGDVSSKINIVEANVNVLENADYTPVIIDYANPKKGTYPLESASATLQDWEFRGNLKTNIFYGAKYVGEIEENAQRVDNGDVYYFKQNKFTHLTPARTKVVNGKEVHYNAGKMTLYPYRAYFYKKGVGGSAKFSAYSILVVDEFGNTTDITNAIFGDGEGDGKIYDLNGIRVMQPVKGRLYIVNGQKKVYR